MQLQIKWINGWAHVRGAGPDGTRIRRALKTRDPDKAEEARAQLEARIWKIGLYGASEVVTFDECALAYVQDGGESRFIMPIATALRGRKLKDITPKEIRDVARKLHPNSAPATLNRQIITPARAVINFGHQQGWCAAIKVRSFAIEKPKRQAVGRDYLDRLRPHLPVRLFALMLFLHTTGRRIGDALNIKPEHVDLQRMRVMIPMTKNGEPAIAYLTAEVAELITGLEPRYGLTFGYIARSSVYSTIRRACSKAGLAYLGTHQPGRHSFATTLSDAGWQSKAIAEAGGWKSVRLVAETYEHPQSPGEKAAILFGKAPKRTKRG